MADLGEWGWRLLYVLPLLALPLVRGLARHLPESRRFQAPHPEARLPGHGRRFWLLATSAFLFNLLAAPAAFFMNRYLTLERGFSATGVSAFALLTNLPGGIGVIVGGRLADTRGRRPVGAVAVVGYAAGTALTFLASGASMWAWASIGSVVGAATLPALGV